MANLIGGVAYMTIDGKNYTTSVEEGYSIKIINQKFEPVMGSDGSLNYTRVPTPDTFSGTILMTQDVTPALLTGATNASITIELASGKTANFRNCIFTGDGSVDSSKGTFSLEFAGIGKWL